MSLSQEREYGCLKDLKTHPGWKCFLKAIEQEGKATEEPWLTTGKDGDVVRGKKLAYYNVEEILKNRIEHLKDEIKRGTEGDTPEDLQY